MPSRPLPRRSASGTTGARTTRTRRSEHAFRSVRRQPRRQLHRRRSSVRQQPRRQLHRRRSSVRQQPRRRSSPVPMGLCALCGCMWTSAWDEAAGLGGVAAYRRTGVSPHGMGRRGWAAYRRTGVSPLGAVGLGGAPVSRSWSCAGRCGAEGAHTLSHTASRVDRLCSLRRLLRTEQIQQR